MAKKDEDNLRNELNLERAMRLTKYREPHPIDIEAALERSTEAHRLGTKIAYGYTFINGKVEHTWFSKRRTGNDVPLDQVFEDPTLALIAHRNRLARLSAERLLNLDAQIDQYVTGSGLVPGVIAMRSDVVAAGVDVQKDGAKVEGSPELQAALDVLLPADDGKTGGQLIGELEDETLKTMVYAYLAKNGCSVGDTPAVREAIRRVKSADAKTLATLAKVEPAADEKPKPTRTPRAKKPSATTKRKAKA